MSTHGDERETRACVWRTSRDSASPRSGRRRCVWYRWQMNQFGICTVWSHDRPVHGRGRTVRCKDTVCCKYLKIFFVLTLANCVLPVLLRLEPELQRSVSIFSPSTVDVGLVVVVTLQGVQDRRSWRRGLDFYILHQKAVIDFFLCSSNIQSTTWTTADWWYWMSFYRTKTNSLISARLVRSEYECFLFPSCQKTESILLEEKSKTLQDSSILTFIQ